MSSTLERVPEKSAHGLPPAYASLRAQVIDALPQGLREEVARVAPDVRATPSHDVISAARSGAEAYAHLAALKGWLDAVIDAD